MVDISIFKGRKDGVQVVTYSSADAEVKLIPLGDVHLGSPTCNVKKFLKTIDYIKKSGSLVILMGDLMEAASRHSVGAGWVEQVITPQDQLDFFEEILYPIREQIIVVLDGNHEERIWKQTGIRVSKILAKALKVPYGGYSCFVKLRVQSHNYIIHAQHGSSSAWYPHTKITAAMRTAQHTTADLYLYGHTHELMSLALDRREFDIRSRTVKRKKQYFCLTGGFLEYESSYAQRKNMYPTKCGVAKIKFFGDRWDIHIST